MTIRVGYHASIQGGYQNAPIQARNTYGLDTFQFFLSSPRSWSWKEITDDDVTKFKETMSEMGFKENTVHLTYLANPSTPKSDKDLREKVIASFRRETLRSDILGVTNLVFHLGSHKGAGFDTAKEMIVEILNDVITPKIKVNLLLETSAGSKNSVGSSFTEIGEIIEEIHHKDKVGVCFDTCHVFAAGYDIRTAATLDTTLEEFDSAIGLKYLKLVHANDSKGQLGEGKDRHENLGKGHIGITGFEALCENKALSDLTFLLETPSAGVKKDIDILRKLS